MVLVVPVAVPVHHERDRGLRHVQLVGGLGETQMPGRGLESAEGIQGRQLAFHGGDIFMTKILTICYAKIA